MGPEQIRSLRLKLGVKNDTNILVLSAPAELNGLFGSLKQDKSKSVDLVVAFFIDKHSLDTKLENLALKLNKNAKLWLCWPKKSGRIRSGLSDEIVRQLGLSSGLVDTKVVSINENWSALRFNKRIESY